MQLSKIVLLLSLVCLCAFAAFAQKTKPVAGVNAQTVKLSPAYAEVLLRKTEILSEIESLLVEYTEEFPKLREMRYQGALLQKELDKLSALNAPEASRLSAALGKLMVKKCELQTDLWALQQQFNDQHPDVKRARRKTEIYEAAINDILQAK